jgi:hypothetical protein
MRDGAYLRARHDDLVIRELPDELLVYDTETHDAHCLNETAAFIWRQCDGKTSVPEIAQRLSAKTETDVDEELVWGALEDLWKRQLLVGESAPARERTMSRGQLVRRAAIVAAVSVPVVTSIVAPKAAQAASCLGPGAACDGATPCCSTGLPCPPGQNCG